MTKVKTIHAGTAKGLDGAFESLDEQTNELLAQNVNIEVVEIVDTLYPAKDTSTEQLISSCAVIARRITYKT